MSTDSQKHFASAVLAAFEKRGLTTDEMVRYAGGPSNTTMTVLRKVARGETTMKEPRSDTAARIEQAAYWTAGSVVSLWREGKEPALRPPPVTADDFRRESDPDRERPIYPPLPKMHKRAPMRIDPYDPAAYVARHVADLEDRIEVLETFMEEQTKKEKEVVAGADGAAPNTEAGPRVGGSKPKRSRKTQSKRTKSREGIEGTGQPQA